MRLANDNPRTVHVTVPMRMTPAVAATNRLDDDDAAMIAHDVAVWPVTGSNHQRLRTRARCGDRQDQSERGDGRCGKDEFSHFLVAP